MDGDGESDGILWNPHEWEWHISDQDTLNRICNDVELLPQNRVKYNDVRSVYQVDDLFLKIEHPDAPLRQLKSRLFPKAESEFEIAQLLKEESIPTVEYLGWGACGSRNILVSRAFPGASSVHDYFYRNYVYADGQYEHFVALLTDFLRLFFRSNFYHDDLHLGNLLFSPEMGEIVLVDLIDITKEEELSPAQLRRMQRVVLELREGLSEEDMLLAITGTNIAINIAAAKEFFLNGVAEEAQRRLAEWPKRRRQILDGYHKFVTPVIKGDHLTMLRKNDLQEEIISPEEWENQAIRNDYELREYSEKQAECLFLRSIFLQLCLVPHRKVAAWESPGKIYFEPMPELNTTSNSSSGIEFFAQTLAEQEIVVNRNSIAQGKNGKFLLTELEDIETLID